MPTLSAYTNVENTALVILRQKGFQIWYDKELDCYCAEKGGWDFFANGAVELLGVVTIFEYHNPLNFREYWWKIDEPNLVRNLPSKPLPYKPVWEKMMKPALEEPLRFALQFGNCCLRTANLP